MYSEYVLFMKGKRRINEREREGGRGREINLAIE